MRRDLPLVEMAALIKIVAGFLSNLAIVYFNCGNRSRFEFNLCVLNMHKCWRRRILMPRFYFNLASKDSHIPDDFGKELDTLHDAYMHARKLIDKILFRVGHDDAEAWKVVILNDQHDAQMIIPFSVSPALSAQRRATLRESSKT